MDAIPRLHVRRATDRRHGNTRHALTYRDAVHERLPHVVKFSGGRSSAMLLFTLLENGSLKQERGDVVVFNNTSCEHPETYRFVAECKRRVEQTYGIPLLLTEFQTYEDARRGRWRRLQSYRLVNDRPRSSANPDGFHWRGEVFEELVSHKAYLPNRHRRVCTAELKLGPTRGFLADWLACKPGIDALGHGWKRSRVDLDEMYELHRRTGGTVPRQILVGKRRFALGRPTRRPGQAYADFSEAALPFDNPTSARHVFGGRAELGRGTAEYVVLIGLRGDEPARITRVRARAADPHAKAGHDGEHVYMPLESIGINRHDVNRFWSRQSWDLALDPSAELSKVERGARAPPLPPVRLDRAALDALCATVRVAIDNADSRRRIHNDAFDEPRITFSATFKRDRRANRDTVQIDGTDLETLDEPICTRDWSVTATQDLASVSETAIRIHAFEGQGWLKVTSRDAAWRRATIGSILETVNAHAPACRGMPPLEHGRGERTRHRSRDGGGVPTRADRARRNVRHRNRSAARKRVGRMGDMRAPNGEPAVQAGAGAGTEQQKRERRCLIRNPGPSSSPH